MRIPALLTAVGAALALLVAATSAVDGQTVPTVIELATEDGVTVVGDLYWSEATRGRPLLLLFHQGGGDARGEYGPLVPRLMDAGFNALAIDQRRGGDRFGGVNRTIERLPNDAEYSYCDARPDLEAALAYARELEPEVRPVLWGSSYTAALVFRLAAEHADQVSGVLAFSPASGEPMEGCEPEPWGEDLAVPTLVLRPGSEAEIPRIAEQLEVFAGQGHRTYVARPGVHGSSMLNPARVEGETEPTWAVVLAFLEGLGS